MKPVTGSFICCFTLSWVMAKPQKEKKTFNVWKIIALAFVAVFCVIIVISVIRLYHFEPHRSFANPAQVDLAKGVVSQDLSRNGDNISNYKIQASDMAREFARDGLNKNIIQISLYDRSKRHLYLVDADSGDIIMHSETTFYGWMENQTPPESPRPGPRRRPFFWGGFK
jgi:hypothetical protein